MTSPQRTKTEPAKIPFRPEIEGIRAVAVILVVLYHAGLTWIPGGYVGVDVFFVLSGYLITGQLWTNLVTTGRISFGGFFARRARRLLPAAALVLSLSSLAAVLLLPVTAWKSIAWDVVFSALSVGNYRFAAEATDYFSQGGAPSPVLHYWSLGVEEQFYLVWPVLLFCASLVWLKRAKRGEAKMRARTTLAVLLVFAVSLTLSIYVTQINQPIAFYSLPTRAWELALGGLLALSATQFVNFRQQAGNALGWLGLALIVIAATVFNDQTLYPSLYALVPALGTAALVFSSGSHVFGFLRLKPMRAIGRWSYSFYLWHWPILIFGAALVSDAELPMRVKLLLVLGALILSGLTYKFFENPIRMSSWLAKNSARSLALGLSLVVFASASGFVLTIATVPTTSTVTSTVPLGATSDLAAAVKRSLGTLPVPSNLTPKPENASVTAELASHGTKCMATFDETEFPECAFGDASSDFTIWLVGDSHANHWFAAIEAVAKKHGAKLILHTRSGCPILDVALANPKAKAGDYDNCTSWTKKVFEGLRADKPNLLIVGGTIGITGFHLESYGRSIQKLSGLSEATIVLGDSPRAVVEVPSCVAENPTDYSRCNLQINTPGEDVQWGDLVATAKSYAVGNNVTYQATSDWLCNGNDCPAIIGNVLVYREISHLTVAGAKLMTPYFEMLISPFIESAGN